MIQISEYLSYLWITHQSALKHHLPIDQGMERDWYWLRKEMRLTTFQWNIKKRDVQYVCWVQTPSVREN